MIPSKAFKKEAEIAKVVAIKSGDLDNSINLN
jgi:hypothetical protein